jgi:aerobic carbon-monoxide dehydrogenase medium subunit
MKAPPFEYRRPASLEEALEDLERAGDDGRVLAGGQSLVPLLAFRLARPAVLVDVNGIGLSGVEVGNGRVRIGAVVRQRAAERAGVGPLTEALRLVGHPPIRNRGTVVGSICHADPAAELPALALALDGVLEVRSRRGGRELPVADLIQGPLTTSLEPDELAVALRLQVPAGWRWRVVEVSRRQGDFALVGVVAGTSPDGTLARAVVFGAAPRPYRVEGPPADLPELAVARAEPVDDLHTSAAHRRHLAGALTDRALRSLGGPGR